MTPREELVAEIAREEQRLTELRSEVNDRTVHLSALREQLALLPPAAPSRPEVAGVATTTPSNHSRTSRDVGVSSPSSGASASNTLSNAEKVALFRPLFRGREDVFPRRWENQKTGKSGYSPACSNEWEHGLCQKKRGKGEGRRSTCAECPNQAFLPVTDKEIGKHLRGDQVMGVYPLLPDETCWFLAADFDKKDWQADVAAFVETSRAHGLPVAIERSRSGDGAHAWFFFAHPVAASVARKMGCFLTTEAMARRHQLSMESYDRLFPNQDTMPKGGFGNLIALPLQRTARAQANSVFVDDALVPFADQWAFIMGIQRIDAALVHAVADEASRRGQVIGVRMGDIDDEEGRTPWARPPSGRPRRVAITGPLPKDVGAVLAQRLFVEKAGLPSPLLNQIKHIAAFQNPEFYKKQSMRLSTALTPRVVACAEELIEHIALPRGCRAEVESLLGEHGVALKVQDERTDGASLGYRFRGTLTAIQEQAVRALLAHDTGVFVAPPGIGKTVVGTYMVAARAKSTLILVHRRPLFDQWIAQLALFLGIEPKDVGRIGAGKSKPNGRLDVAMLQSLVRKGEVKDLVAGYGHVISDECHHASCVSFERVLAEVKARYITGLTATPQRRDGLHPIMYMQLGPKRFVVDAKSQAARRPFVHKLIVRETGSIPKGIPESGGIQALYSALVLDQWRNDLIFDDVVQALEERRSPILLSERREHLEHFAERLRAFTRHLVVLHGGMKSKERKAVAAQLAAIPDDEERLLIATGKYIGEGFDDARLDTLFLALPVSWKGTLVQYTGRLHRLHPRKAEVRIYDYVDGEVPMLFNMFKKRLRSYRAIGYARGEAPLGLGYDGDHETVIEYDEEALRHFDEDE